MTDMTREEQHRIIGAADELTKKLNLPHLAFEPEGSEMWLHNQLELENPNAFLVPLNDFWMSEETKNDHREERDTVLPDIIAAANMLPKLIEIIDALFEELSYS